VYTVAALVFFAAPGDDPRRGLRGLAFTLGDGWHWGLLIAGRCQRG
jgi:hypothetical protein